MKRATWLVILFVGELLTALPPMGIFEEEIEKAVVLALFVPLIISSGGNSEAAGGDPHRRRPWPVGEIALRNWKRKLVLKQELFSGLLPGALSAGMVGFARIALWSSFSSVYGPHWPLIGLTVAISLVGIVL